MLGSSDGTLASRRGIATASGLGEYSLPARGYVEEDATGHLSGTAKSTGKTIVATDVKLMFQPLRLLRNVDHCEIHGTSSLEMDATIMDMVGGCNEVMTSTQELHMEDPKLVHDTSEEPIYHVRNLSWTYHTYERDQGQQRLDSILWQTGK